MRNMLDKTNQKLKNIERKNNKGFTLVELIIVIAIIAVLAAVLAPQYIKYVDRAHKSNDISVASELLKAAQTAALDPDNGDDTFTVTWASNGASPEGTITVADDGSTGGMITKAIGNVMNGADNITAIKPESKFAQTAPNLVITVTNGVATVNGTANDAATWAGSMGANVTAA